MHRAQSRTTIEAIASRFRQIVLDSDENALIGSEDALVAQLGCSRTTVRQVARLLEREGLLKVKRGINGGYFGTRPDAGTIEATVSSYLAMLDMDPSDVTVLASALWIEAMQKASRADRIAARALGERIRPKLLRINENARFEEVRKLEMEIQKEVFQLANAAYIKLIFEINAAFSRRRFGHPVQDDDSTEHRDFVRDWRDAKLLELGAIVRGDRDLAIMAARYSRQIWHRKLWRRFSTLPHSSMPSD